MTTRTTIIGDVHGCLDELDELLALIRPAAGDHIHFLGDLVDRGPDSLGVVRRVRALLDEFPGSVCIAGNHEDKALRYRERGRPVPAWAEAAEPDDWRFLEQLPLIHKLPEHEAVMVHGGFFPAFFEAYGELGEVPANWRTAKGKRADRMRRFLRIRQVNSSGNMISLYQATAADQRWAELYDGREGFVFHGHDARPELAEPEVVRHTMNLDTGCCFGGCLSAAILEPGMAGADAATLSIPARETYSRYFEDDKDA